MAAALGLGLHPLAPHSFDTPPKTPGLLLGFAALSPGEIEVAERLPGRAVDTL